MEYIIYIERMSLPKKKKKLQKKLQDNPKC